MEGVRTAFFQYSGATIKSFILGGWYGIRL